MLTINLRKRLIRNLKDIDDIYAVYVFRPEKARGENGVILRQFLGIGDVRDI
jgi:hypothetical protein